MFILQDTHSISTLKENVNYSYWANHTDVAIFFILEIQLNRSLMFILFCHNEGYMQYFSCMLQLLVVLMV